MKTTKNPNPERVYEAIVKILQRRYDVKIVYELLPKNQNQGGSYESNCNPLIR